MPVHKMQCAWPDPPPDMHMTMACVSGGCPDQAGTLGWDAKNNQWGGVPFSMYWDGFASDYRFVGQTKGGALSQTGVFRCAPAFKAVILGWGPDDNGCLYDVTIEPEQA